MAEVWRRGSDPAEVQNATTQHDEAVAEKLPDQTPALPATVAPASNPTLNRSAEVVGRSVGTAVSEVRRLPRRLGNLKSRIHLVSKEGSRSAHHVRDSAESRVAELFDEAEIGLLELADKAAIYTSEIGSRANNRIAILRREARWKLHVVRTIARSRLEELRRWQPERPLQVVMVAASAAFAVGVMLRIWRSSHD